METVQKKIHLEPYRSRLYGGLPYVEGGKIKIGAPGESNWGKIIANIDFSKFTQAERNKYGNSIVNWGKMTYHSLITEYYRIKNETEDTKKALSEIDADNFYADITEDMKRALVNFVEAHRTVVGVSYETDACNCPVPKIDDTYTVDWVNFTGDNDPRYSFPNININLSLKQKANLIGSYTFLPKDWIPGKRYYIGDIVLYNNQAYELNSTTFTDEGCEDFSGELSADAKSLISGPFYLFKWENPDQETETKLNYEYYFFPAESLDEMLMYGYPAAVIGNTYYAKPYWAGYQVEGKHTRYFDELRNGVIPKDSNGGTQHWKLHNISKSVLDATVESSSGGKIKVDAKGVDFNFESEVETVIGESKLDEFYTVVRTVDYFTNEKFPGKVNGNLLELPYAIGYIRNIESNEDGEYIGDYLHGIKIDGGSVITSMSDYLSWLGGKTSGDTGTISFVYYVGCSLDYDGETLTVRDGEFNHLLTVTAEYEDKYDFTVDVFEGGVDNGEDEPQRMPFKYLNIDYESGSGVVNLENIDNLPHTTKLSEITYNRYVSDILNESPNFVTVPVIMEDYKLGITYIDNNKIEDLTIDRGNAAAFERHLRISEVNSMSDLENYGNGFFQILK